MERSNWLYWRIQEWGSIPPDKWKAAPRGCTKWKAFVGRNGQDEGIILKRQRVVSGAVTFPWEGRGSHQAGHRLVVMRVGVREVQAAVGNPAAGEGCDAGEVGTKSWWGTATTSRTLSLGKYKVKVTYVRNVYFIETESN